ncbi:hypothetical protein KR038_008275 [Drosophila bunnanda]|nr:hypothetical protein KR038_008275 [Drosophila bunnanda]
MSTLQKRSLANLQGVPVENRQDEILGCIREIQLAQSPNTLSRTSLLKRFFKISNKPLRLAHIRNKSATSFREDNDNTSTFPFFTRKKQPIPDRTLSFVNNHGQSTSMENQIPQDMPIARPTTHKLSISVYWNRLFHRQKSQPNVEDPAPETIAKNEEDVLVLKLQQEHNSEGDTQSANDSENEEPPPGARQEQELASEPEPTDSKPETPMKSDQLPVATQTENHWKRWFHRLKGQLKKEAPAPKIIAGNETEKVLLPELQMIQDDADTESASDSEKPSPGATEEQHIPIERVEPETSIESDCISVVAKTENAEPNQSVSDKVELPMDTEPERLKPMTHKKRFSRNLLEGQLLSTFEPDPLAIAADPEDVKPNQPSSYAAEQKDAEVQESERLKPPPTPKRKTAGNVYEEQIVSTLQPDHLSIAVETEDVEPNQPESDEVHLPIDHEPERLKPKIPKKRSARNSSEEQISRSFERDQLSIPAEPEDAEPHETSSDGNDLPIDPKPKTRAKRDSRNVSEVQSLSSFERYHLSIAVEPEDVEHQVQVSDEVNQPINHDPERLKPETTTSRFPRSLSEEPTLSTFEQDQLPVAAEPGDEAPNQPASDVINPNP